MSEATHEPHLPAVPAPAAGARSTPLVHSGYIVGARYDWFFFLLPPLMALALGMQLPGTSFNEDYWEFFGWEVTWSSLLIGIFIHAHLFIVVFRSHGNPQIFKTFPARFVLAPIILWLAIVSSVWVAVCASVLATFWDVYHSGMQIFGFARLYDAKAGNDRSQGRRLDWTLNQILYAGPILAGATMMSHFDDFEKFDEVGAVLLTSVPAFMESNQRYYAWLVIAAGTVFLIYYLFAYWRLHRQGHIISWQKVFLLAATGFCSVYTWGFNSWGEAFFIMNFFHALQYFGLVWHTENKNMARLFRTERLPYPRVFTAMVFVGLAVLYGAWVEGLDTSFETLWAITLVMSLMHFWYDGFIWSVRKKQL